MTHATGRRLKLPITTIQLACEKMSSLCLFLRVSTKGEVRLDGMIRIPYSDRPKVGGGKRVPWSALNPRVQRFGYKLPPRDVPFTGREIDAGRTYELRGRERDLAGVGEGQGQADRFGPRHDGASLAEPAGGRVGVGALGVAPGGKGVCRPGSVPRVEGGSVAGLVNYHQEGGCVHDDGESQARASALGPGGGR